MSLTTVLIIGLIVLVVVARRVYGEPVRARRLLIAPLIELAVGGYELVRHADLPTAGWVSLALTGVLSLALGAGRGATIHLFERRGYLWQRYRPRTFLVWGAAFVARFGVRALFVVAGLTPAVSLTGHTLDDGMIGTMLITSGLGFLGESMVLAPRVLRTGVPLAPAGQRGGLLSSLWREVSGARGRQSARHWPTTLGTGDSRRQGPAGRDTRRE